MSPERTARKVTDQLMIVFKEATTTDPTVEEMQGAYGYSPAPSGKRYLLKRDSFAALERAAVKLATLTDDYPTKQCVSHLREIAVAEKDAGTPAGQAYDRMRSKVFEFLKSFDSQGKWEVVFAVRGIDPDPGPFQVGPCSFYMMDDDQFTIWGRRYSSGVYEPPPDTPLYQVWLKDEAPMRGQFVAAARVRAINHEHALTKGRRRTEEAINLLRYGQLVAGFPESNFPEIGFWVRQWQHDHSFAVQIDHPNFGTSRLLGGPAGCLHSVCVRTPGWAGLEKLITLDRPARNEIQVRLSTAMQWIGQAALAPSGSIRLVALVTALEALLIDDTESAGKKTKLATRVAGLVATAGQEALDVSKQVQELYRNRSECVHGGSVEVESGVLAGAIRLVARTVEAIAMKPPFSNDATLPDILDRIDPPVTTLVEDRRKWVAENSYCRWLSEGNPTNRERQHWFDAEREYLCNLVLKGRPLDSIRGLKRVEGEPDAEE